MKQPIKVYLDRETHHQLIQKAQEAGFIGRGALSLFLQKIAQEDLVFMDNNVKKILHAINFSVNDKHSSGNDGNYTKENK